MSTATAPATASADGPGRSPQPSTGILDRPLTSLHMVLVSGGLLLGIGLVMVLSASMNYSYAHFGTTYGVFKKQLMWVGIGIPVFWLGLRLPPRAYRALAYPALFGAAALLLAVLVPGIGANHGTIAHRWIDVGPLQLQPSEPAKLALALWGADLLTRKQRMLDQVRHLVLPLVPVAMLMAGLVVVEPDLGTAICLGLVLFGLLWTVGAAGRFFVALGGAALAAVLVLIYFEPYRMARWTSFLDPFKDRSGDGYQAVQGLYSLSSGGLFGVGLGQSKMKWGYLFAAHTDYIFAIIGEELGLLGCLVVMSLFTMLAYAGIRIARRAADPFVRLVAAAVTVWLTGQAVINMGYVTGLLPVTGIPLPLISFGGTALIVTMFVIGMLASFARHEPAAVSYLSGRRRSRLARLCGLPTPRPPAPRSAGPARPRPAKPGSGKPGSGRSGSGRSGSGRSGSGKSGSGRSGSGKSGSGKSGSGKSGSGRSRDTNSGSGRPGRGGRTSGQPGRGRKVDAAGSGTPAAAARTSRSTLPVWPDRTARAQPPSRSRLPRTGSTGSGSSSPSSSSPSSSSQREAGQR